MKKNPLEKHCPRPAKKEKGLSQNPAKSPWFQRKNSRGKVFTWCSWNFQWFCWVHRMTAVLAPLLTVYTQTKIIYRFANDMIYSHNVRKPTKNGHIKTISHNMIYFLS
jgi:hypothetical protein